MTASQHVPRARGARPGGDWTRIGHLHVGLKGTMNALYLKELAEKTRRGLRGRVEAGKSGGGLSYGYRVVRTLNEAGVVPRGTNDRGV